MNTLDMGLMVEGIVELDPMSGRLIIRYQDKSGAFQTADIQERLLQYRGEEVRCIITPTATIAQIARLVENGGMKLEEVPPVPKLS